MSRQAPRNGSGTSRHPGLTRRSPTANRASRNRRTWRSVQQLAYQQQQWQRQQYVVWFRRLGSVAYNSLNEDTEGYIQGSVTVTASQVVNLDATTILMVAVPVAAAYGTRTSYRRVLRLQRP